MPRGFTALAEPASQAMGGNRLPIARRNVYVQPKLERARGVIASSGEEGFPRNYAARGLREERSARIASNEVKLCGRNRTRAAHNKIGAKSGDPNRHSRPRLPGSVVGEPSMLQAALPGKITKVTVPR